MKTELQRSSSAYQRKINQYKRRVGFLLTRLTRRKTQAKKDFITIRNLRREVARLNLLIKIIVMEKF